MSITAEEKAKVISDFATKKGDTGSIFIALAGMTSSQPSQSFNKIRRLSHFFLIGKSK